VERFVSRKDAVAFELLVRRHGPMVLGVCRRVLRNHADAEDAFQATFLVLARKADTIVPRERVANWLYGVAYRTACKARALAARRRARESQVPEMPDLPTPEPDSSSLDLQTVLDQELSRLPDKYRVAIVLCDLEGHSGKDVARQMGCPEGTVASRLSRGRALLAKRLTRRGLALSGASLAAHLAQEAGAATVPAALVSPTIKAAKLLVAGQGLTTGLVSAKVAAVTEGVLQVMFLRKVSTTLAGLLLLGAVTVTCGVLAGGRPDARAREVQENRDKGKDAPQEPKELATLTGHTDRVDSLAFSPGDGKTLASASADGMIRLWDVTRNRNTAILQVGTPVACVAFSPDGKTLASGGHDSKVKLWDVATANNTASIQAVADNATIITCVAFSPDGKILASGSENQKIKLWNLANRKETATLAGHQGIILSVAFSPDGKTLASAGGDGTVKLWDVEAGKEIRTLRGHTNTPEISYVYGVAFSPDGKALASSGQDGTVRLWDAATGKNTATLKGHLLVQSVSFSKDGNTLASGGTDQAVKLWDVATGKNLANLQGHADPVTSVVFSPDGVTLASGSLDKTIRLWRVK
jgi:RNA polymerase sigma factor (sigma-70 family)